MKVTFRIPTREQYAYIEVETEFIDDEDVPRRIAEAYQKLTNAYHEQVNEEQAKVAPF